MTKWQLIDDIQRLNRSATRNFLEQFGENELDLYLRKLLRQERRYGTADLLQPLLLRFLD
ncbi:MAG: hypothetical protein IIA33_08940 [Planctomycetes bacterium]|nr:hypothetical protein [Planctomycetota bacterium]